MRGTIKRNLGPSLLDKAAWFETMMKARMRKSPASSGSATVFAKRSSDLEKRWTYLRQEITARDMLFENFEPRPKTNP